MILQTLTSVIYDITSHSWAVASVVVKYYLAATAAYMYTRDELTMERFADRLINQSRMVLMEIVLLGTLLYIFSFKPSPLFRLFSELIALGYLGFLFWNY